MIKLDRCFGDRQKKRGILVKHFLIAAMLLGLHGCSSCSETKSTLTKDSTPVSSPQPVTDEMRMTTTQDWLRAAEEMARCSQDKEAAQVVDFLRTQTHILKPHISPKNPAEVYAIPLPNQSKKKLALMPIFSQDGSIHPTWKGYLQHATPRFEEERQTIIFFPSTTFSDIFKASTLLHEGEHAIRHTNIKNLTDEEFAAAHGKEEADIIIFEKGLISKCYPAYKSVVAREIKRLRDGLKASNGTLPFANREDSYHELLQILKITTPEEVKRLNTGIWLYATAQVFHDEYGIRGREVYAKFLQFLRLTREEKLRTQK